jgi:hypothetical protein
MGSEADITTFGPFLGPLSTFGFLGEAFIAPRLVRLPNNSLPHCTSFEPTRRLET